MKEDFLNEGDMFGKENVRQLKTGFTWVLILLMASFVVDAFHLIMRLIYNNKFYQHAKAEDFERMNTIYRSFAVLFLLMYLSLYTIAAIKVNNIFGRFVIIFIGFFHLVSFMYYQFLVK